MLRPTTQLRDDALAIWRAGVAAVQPAQLFREQVRVDGDWLLVADEALDLRPVGRIAVVGAGKAAAGMALALENALGPRVLRDKQVDGWVNVPADCLMETERIHLHAGRPPGVNEPRPEGVLGTSAILRLVESLMPVDLCICLLSGGGSALLVAPVPEVTLAEKIEVTRQLSAAGANIEQLNTVRRALSRIKGGGLARACRAGRLVSLIISDVLGDRLDTIASGPTTPSATTPEDALSVLDDLGLIDNADVSPVVAHLRNAASSTAPASAATAQITNLILANNATAVDAAGIEAERRGYSHAMTVANSSEGLAEKIGERLALMALRMRARPGPDCLISGGEPVVSLVDESVRGLGGRNQQLALAALTMLGDGHGLALVSGGTDGEDGPTDAAGAIVDEEVIRRARFKSLGVHDYLGRNDAYHFFEQVDGLLKTGPTHTNVCDLRVVTVRRE